MFLAKSIMYRFAHIVLIALLVLMMQACAFRRISRAKNITYRSADTSRHIPEQKLSVFTPRNHKVTSGNVFVFVHGGNWKHGKKSLYYWFGSRLARKGVVAIVIDYPKAPLVNYHTMTEYVASSIKWVNDHVSEYGGSPDRIFLSGHSSGGHLAALVTMDESYFKKVGLVDPVKGLVLIDAAGMDMYRFMKSRHEGEAPSYDQIFTKDPAKWKDASPLYHMHSGIPPMLIFSGGKTYPSIAASNEKLLSALKRRGEKPEYDPIPQKKHIGMITQFFNTGNGHYKEIMRFLNKDTLTSSGSPTITRRGTQTSLR
jgi:acetyl esterase/lipase